MPRLDIDVFLPKRTTHLYLIFQCWWKQSRHCFDRNFAESTWRAAHPKWKPCRLHCETERTLVICFVRTRLQVRLTKHHWETSVMNAQSQLLWHSHANM